MRDSLTDLQLAISNLWDEFGQADSLTVAMAINVVTVVVCGAATSWLYPHPAAVLPFAVALVTVPALLAGVKEVLLR